MPNRVEHLQALMLTVETALITCAEREVAALSREKRQILAELDALEGLAEGSVIDELARKRKDRRAAAAARTAT